MIAIITVLFALPLGFFLRNRTSAFIAYIAIFGYSFTFQSVYLLRFSIGGDGSAFPADPKEMPFGYLVVTAGVYLAGFLLVALGHRLGTKRRTRSTVPVDLDPAH
jgi:hypothetical protein